jgi:hypothetical protein
MGVNMKKIWTLIFLSFLIFNVTNGYALNESDPESLRGIKGILINVQVNELARDMGLSQQQIQTDTELKLRMAGIKVISQSDLINSSDAPILNIRIGIQPPVGTNIAYMLNVDFLQYVRLERNSDIKVLATTWSRAMYGAGGKSYIGSLRDFTKDKIDEFINDFLSVNQK